MPQADIYGKAVCIQSDDMPEGIGCGTTVEGHLTGTAVCPKCGGSMQLVSANAQ